MGVASQGEEEVRCQLGSQYHPGRGWGRGRVGAGITVGGRQSVRVTIRVSMVHIIGMIMGRVMVREAERRARHRGLWPWLMQLSCTKAFFLARVSVTHLHYIYTRVRLRGACLCCHARVSIPVSTSY